MKKISLLLFLLLIPSVFALSSIERQVTITADNVSTKIIIEGGNEFKFPTPTTSAQVELKPVLLIDAQKVCGNVTQACDNDVNLLVNAFANQTEQCIEHISSYKEFINQYYNITSANNTLAVELEGCRSELERQRNIPVSDNTQIVRDQLTTCNVKLQEVESSKWMWGFIGLALGAAGYYWYDNKRFASNSKI